MKVQLTDAVEAELIPYKGFASIGECEQRLSSYKLKSISRMLDAKECFVIVKLLGQYYLCARSSYNEHFVCSGFDTMHYMMDGCLQSMTFPCVDVKGYLNGSFVMDVPYAFTELDRTQDINMLMSNRLDQIDPEYDVFEYNLPHHNWLSRKYCFDGITYAMYAMFTMLHAKLSFFRTDFASILGERRAHQISQLLLDDERIYEVDPFQTEITLRNGFSYKKGFYYSSMSDPMGGFYDIDDELLDSHETIKRKSGGTNIIPFRERKRK